MIVSLTVRFCQFLQVPLQSNLFTVFPVVGFITLGDWSSGVTLIERYCFLVLSRILTFRDPRTWTLPIYVEDY